MPDRGACGRRRRQPAVCGGRGDARPRRTGTVAADAETRRGPQPRRGRRAARGARRDPTARGPRQRRRLPRGIRTQVHRATRAVHTGQQVPHAFDEGRETEGERGLRGNRWEIYGR